MTACDVEFEETLDNGYSEDDRATLRRGLTRTYERLAPQFALLYELLATYQHCVDREDVPIGIQHVLDELMTELVGSDADPMIYLDSVDMYSTTSLVKWVSDLQPDAEGTPAVEGYTGRTPIAVNLPALDLANGLLVPLLAHEVAHTAVDDRLASQLDELTADHREKIKDEAQDLGERAVQESRSRYSEWTDELMCDAVALAIGGPSFLFAFHAYPPAWLNSDTGSHPPPSDRLTFHLSFLEQVGWMPFLEAKVPDLMRWYRSRAESGENPKSRTAQFIRKAVLAEAPTIIDLAMNTVTRPLMAPTDPTHFDEAIQAFADGIPAVQYDKVLSTWEVMLAGWLAVFVDDVSPETAQAAIYRRDFNAMLVKALELSGIASKWELYASAGS